MDDGMSVLVILAMMLGVVVLLLLLLVMTLTMVVLFVMVLAVMMLVQLSTQRTHCIDKASANMSAMCAMFEVVQMFMEW